MGILTVPDPDEFFDHVLDVSGPRRGRQIDGPARVRQAAWSAAVQQIVTDAVEQAAAEHTTADGTTTDSGVVCETTDATSAALLAAVRFAVANGLVTTRADVRRLGVPDPVVRSLVRRGRWSVPRFGVLSPLPCEPLTLVTAVAERVIAPHGLAPQVRAAAAALVRPGTVVSNESAGLIHGLPVLDVPTRPTLSAVDSNRTAVRDDVIVRCVGLRANELVDWFGAPVTGVARTVVDIARASGAAAGLVAADAALHSGLVSHDELARARTDARFRVGVRQVDRVLELADERVESPLESLTRLCLADGGLPLPTPQQWIHTHRGRYRVDLLYPAQRLIIECDGELKYRGERPDPFVDEKRRHEALVRAGFTVVRVSWAEVRGNPAEVVLRVRLALAALSASSSS